MEKTNRFARFHALQSLLYHVLAVVVFVVLSILITVLTMILAAINDSLGCVGILLWLVFLVVGLVYFAGLIFFAIKAYGGNWFKLPIIGNMAEKIVNK